MSSRKSPLEHRIVIAATAALGLSACSSAEDAEPAAAPVQEAPPASTAGREAEAPEEPAPEPTPEPEPAADDDALNLMDSAEDSEAAPTRSVRGRAGPRRPAPSPAQGAEPPAAAASCGASCGAECGGVPGEDEESGGDPAPRP